MDAIYKLILAIKKAFLWQKKLLLVSIVWGGGCVGNRSGTKVRVVSRLK